MHDFSGLNLEQLAFMRQQIDDLVRIRRTERLLDARRQILSIADEVGAPLDTILGDGSKRALRTPALPLRLRHPDHPELTWGGRGRRPKWIRDCLAAGKSIDDLKAF